MTVRQLIEELDFIDPSFEVRILKRKGTKEVLSINADYNRKRVILSNSISSNISEKNK